mmetsp:Transcript_20340/g.37742  ORF Transcript_20340/g.37742 Transcript_20340/m.37742 type:complete len:109 (+) Transcript_20340:25-351(+)
MPARSRQSRANARVAARRRQLQPSGPFRKIEEAQQPLFVSLCREGYSIVGMDSSDEEEEDEQDFDITDDCTNWLGYDKVNSSARTWVVPHRGWTSTKTRLRILQATWK